MKNGCATWEKVDAWKNYKWSLRHVELKGSSQNAVAATELRMVDLAGAEAHFLVGHR